MQKHRIYCYKDVNFTMSSKKWTTMPVMQRFNHVRTGFFQFAFGGHKEMGLKKYLH